MITSSAPKSLRVGLLTLVSVTLLALAPVEANASTPTVKLNVQTSKTLPEKTPAKRTYVLQIGKKQQTVEAKVIEVRQTQKGSVVLVDGKQIASVLGTVAVGVATGANGSGNVQYSQTTTTTQLPGGGTRTDIDHGNGSSTTIIHDPHGGKNGGTRTTTSTTDSEGNTTTTTTTTDGSDGSATTTTTTSP